MASIWWYDRNRVPAVSHRLDCGGHPDRRLIGGQVRQCEQAARGSASRYRRKTPRGAFSFGTK